MKKIWPWIIGLSVLMLVVVIVLLGARLLSFGNLPFIGGRFDQFRFNRTWQPHGRGMHWGYYGGMPLIRLFGWLLMLLVPFGLVALAVLGVFTLVRALSSNDRKPGTEAPTYCDNCGKQVESGWAVCAYCGEPLGGE